MTHRFLTRAVGLLGAPFCKKGSPEGTMPGGGDRDAELDCGKFMEFAVLIGHSGGGACEAAGYPGLELRVEGRLSLGVSIWWSLASRLVLSNVVATSHRWPFKCILILILKS